MTYVKLHASILDSSVWAESHATRIVWITLLAMADQDGLVLARVPGIAARARATRAEVEDALARFRAPDLDSRTEAHEGRKIADTPDGIQILNYELHRDRASAADRAEKHAARQARYRLRHPGKPQKNQNSDAATVTSDAAVTPDDASDTLSLSLSLSSVSAQSQLSLSSEQNRTDQTEGEIATGPAPKRRTRATTTARAAPGAEGHHEDRSALWRMYAVAYRARYGAEPVRNAKVNSQLKLLLSRLPAADLVATVDHYLLSPNARYVAAGHSVGCLLQDAEKLATEARTGRAGTAHAAHRGDKNADRLGQYRELMEKFDREEAEEKLSG